VGFHTHRRVVLHIGSSAQRRESAIVRHGRQASRGQRKRLA
jgi:hypothetical protein